MRSSLTKGEDFFIDSTSTIEFIIDTMEGKSMSQIKMIIMDVDGTMVNSDKVITPRTKEALLKAQASGVRLVIASGRPTSGIRKFADELDLAKNHGLLVSYNGSKVYDCTSKEVIYNQAIAVDQAKRVLEHMKKFNVYPMVDRHGYMNVLDAYAPQIHMNVNDDRMIDIMKYEIRGGNFLICEHRDLAEYVDFEPNKILTAGEPEYLEKVFEEMQAPFKDELNCMFTAPFFFEFTPKGVDKAKALRSICELTNIDESEVIAFGDANNDLTMIEAAGIGVAMSNASPLVLEAADYITLSNDEDGIAHALAKFM